MTCVIAVKASPTEVIVASDVALSTWTFYNHTKTSIPKTFEINDGECYIANPILRFEYLR